MINHAHDFIALDFAERVCEVCGLKQRLVIDFNQTSDKPNWETIKDGKDIAHPFDYLVKDKMVLEKQLDSYALDWIKLRSLTLAKSINKTTMEALRNELALGFEAGESIIQLSKRVEEYFTENAKYRAEMISRSEVIASSNEGALHRFELEGVDKSEFMAAPDACEVCIPLDGKVYPTKESHGIIPLHPFCRCVWLPYLD